VPNPCDQLPWPAPGQPVDYLVSEPDKKADIICPVASCGVTMAGGWYGIRRHFFFRHHTCTVTIVEEEMHPACERCGFQCPLPHRRHQASKLCQAGYARRNRRTSTQAIIINRDFAPEFTAGDTTLEAVSDFKYLGRWMSANDSDAMAVAQNLKKARQRWGQLCRLLTRKHANRRVMGLFYKATVQAVLLYGAETWNLTQPLLRMLRSFHHRCARYLARMTITQLENGEWVCPSSTVTRERAGLATIEEYIQWRVNTFLPFIQSRAIYWECRLSQATQAASNHPVWWASHPMLAPTETMARNDDMVPTKPLWWAAAYHADTANEPNLDPNAATMPDVFLPPRRRSPRRENMTV